MQSTARSVFDSVTVAASYNALNHRHKFSYDAHANLVWQQDPLGNTVTNLFDSAGNVTNTLRFGTSSNIVEHTSSRYEGALLVWSQDAVGTVTTNTYNSLGELIATAMLDVSGGILSSNSFGYDANGNQTTSVVWRWVNDDWEGATNTTVLDAQGRVVQSIDPLGYTNTTVYNALGKVERTIDKLGRGTRHEFDAQGRQFRTVYPDQSVVSTGFDAEGRTRFSTNQAAVVTEYRFDPLGRQTNVVYPDLAKAITYYDDLGRVQYNVDARGVTNAFGYDRAGRRVSVTNALGTAEEMWSTFALDPNGNQLYVTTVAGVLATNHYDSLSRLTNVSFADGTRTFTVFDPAGRRVAETNQDGIVTLFGYDGGGRLTSVTNALGKPEQMVTRYSYDEAGNQTAQIDALNRTNRFEHDKLGRRVAGWLADGTNVERFGFDAVGNQIRHTNFNGVMITNQFDEMNRLTNRNSVDGYSVSYAYSLTGQRTNMVDGSGLTSYSHDSRGRLTNKVVSWTGGPTISLSYRFDARGNLTNLWSSTANGVTNLYQYDSLSRLTNVLANGSAAAGYGFDAVGNLWAVRYGNSVTNLFRYDSLHRLTNAVWKFNTSLLADFTYKLGLTGSRTNLTETVNGASRAYAWHYDALYRLTNETITGASPTGAIGYRHDLVGNRTNRSSTVAGIGNQTASYGANDWLTTDTYDNNGNTLESGGNHFSYDVENRLTNFNNGAVIIAYNGDGARVRKTVGNTTTFYLTDDLNPSGYVQVLEEWTASGGTTNVSRVYNYGLDLISQREAGGVVHYFGYDGHGSTRFLTDAYANVANTLVYDAYGTLFASNSSPQTAYLDTGEQWDQDLGIYYLRARCYEPQTGRFWTMDRVEGDQEAPSSLHRLLYCEGDPVDYIDPSGHEIEGILAVMDVGGRIFASVSPSSSRGGAAFRVALRSRPTSQRVRQLVAAIYAESSSKEYSGNEDGVEKLAIGATIVNQAFYAKLPPGSKQKRNYNAASFGDGTVLGAIKKSIVAYLKREWNQIANAKDLKPDVTIDKALAGTARDHYNLSVDAANAVTAAPMGVREFKNEYPIGFNRAADAPPNPDRQHKIGRAGVHSFYGFDKGHEYQ